MDVGDLETGGRARAKERVVDVGVFVDLDFALFHLEPRNAGFVPGGPHPDRVAKEAPHPLERRRTDTHRDDPGDVRQRTSGSLIVSEDRRPAPTQMRKPRAIAP